jgi:hypothetical protein
MWMCRAKWRYVDKKIENEVVKREDPYRIWNEENINMWRSGIELKALLPQDKH